MKLEQSERNKIQFLVNKALCDLYKKDYHLIKYFPHNCDEEMHVSERGIVFRFGIYLQALLADSSFKHLNLDTEYNRNIKDLKRTERHPNGTYPDLIIHQRGNNKHNLLILEFKTWWNPDNSTDIEKIKEFTSPDGCYQYAIGASIILGETKPHITWIY